MNNKDAKLKLTLALPNGAATTTSTSIDTGKMTSQGRQLAPVEWLLTAPALGATPLPDAKTMTYDVIGSSASDLSSPVVIAGGVVVQTGAGGAGSAGKTARVRLPSTAPRYLGFRATGSASGNASAISATLEAVF